MSREKLTSTGWRKRQERDPYVQKARQEGWRSRAVFKLEQILNKERLLRPDMLCIDLGAAPGGWSQYVSMKLQGRTRILALDLLAMDSLPEVEFIQADFTDEAVVADILQRLDNAPVDLVMSDMAPNMTGSRAVDQPRSMYLAELAMDLAHQVLRPGGAFICKVFQGEGTDAFIAEARRQFAKVRVMKPDASRNASREVYLVARNYHL